MRLKPIIAIASLALAVFTLTGCAKPLGPKITPEQAKAMLDKEKNAVLIDVRTEAEFLEQHIEGAILIPEYEIESRAGKELPDKNALILIYCRSGRRSAIAVKALREMGYTQCYDFGGIIDWPYETVSGENH